MQFLQFERERFDCMGPSLGIPYSVRGPDFSLHGLGQRALRAIIRKLGANGPTTNCILFTFNLRPTLSILALAPRRLFRNDGDHLNDDDSRHPAAQGEPSNADAAPRLLLN